MIPKLAKTTLTALQLLTAIMLLSGCASNPGIVEIRLPTVPEDCATNEKHAFIRSVSDIRVFQGDTRKLDQPSFTYSSPDDVSSETRVRTVGIKRNFSGTALDDILLTEPQTVENVVHEALKLALTGNGYCIADQATPENTLIIEAGITQFWEHVRSGKLDVTLQADISADLLIMYPGTTEPVIRQALVSIDDQYQVANKANWNDIFAKAIRSFIKQVQHIVP